VFQLHVSQEGIGVGSAAFVPEADLHVTNVDGGDTVLKLVNTSEWNLGSTAGGVFTFNLAGSGGQEATFRTRNHPVATFDVQGHVRGTSFKSTSSRALKTGFGAIDATEILARVAELPITTWRYKVEGEQERHVGPMAEDFQRLFGLGDGTTIATIDADGVIMAALQGLNAKVEQQAAEIRGMEAGHLDALRHKDAAIEALEARQAALEQRLAADATP
jgi:hypothetical protein